MKNVKCIVLNNNRFNQISNDMEQYLGVTKLQTYFPIISLFLEIYNESNTNFIFNSNFLITKINKKINIENNDSYIKHFFEAEIINQCNNDKFNKDICQSLSRKLV